MSLINEYRATEEAIKELQARLKNLSEDDKLQTVVRVFVLFNLASTFGAGGFNNTAWCFAYFGFWIRCAGFCIV